MRVSTNRSNGSRLHLADLLAAERKRRHEAEELLREAVKLIPDKALALDIVDFLKETPK